jgi:hypothetical protein
MPISTIGQNGLNAPLSLTSPNLGTPSAINLSNATALAAAAMPAGSIVQVVQATKTDTWNTNAGNGTWIDIPGQGGSGTFQVQITPRSASSRILILSHIPVSNTGGQVNRAQLRRDSTPIFTGDTAGGRPLGTGQAYFADAAFGGQSSPSVFNIGGTYVDSPATTSTVTYRYLLGADNVSGSAQIRLNTTNRDSNGGGADTRTAASIIVMEIQG